MSNPSSSEQNWTNIGDFIVDMVKTGARGVIVGEYHHRNSSIRLLTAEFERLKREAGVTTFYAEYIQRDNQAVLDAALRGDRRSQLRIRSMMEAAWAYGGDDDQSSTITPQARYDQMFAAHRAGLRVFGVYNDSSDFRSDVDTRRRTTLGDQVIAGVVRENDDGHAFIIGVGDRHTAKGRAHNIHTPDEDKDGLHAQLVRLGIPVISLSIDHGTGPNSIIPSPDKNYSDFLWTAPAHEEGYPPVNPALERMGLMETGKGVLTMKADLLKDPQTAGKLHAARKDLEAVRIAYGECRMSAGMVENLEGLAVRISSATSSQADTSVRRRTPEERAEASLNYELGKITSPLVETLRDPISLLDGGACSKETTSQTYRPPAP